jgi:acyl carrier protein
MSNLKEEVKALICEIIEVEPEKLAEEAKFVEDLGVDSLMALEILAYLEKKYRVKIPEDKLMSLVNLKQTVELMEEVLKTQTQSA